jgi:hypothetical protein
MSYKNKYPVTLVGHMRLHGKWFSNMLERELSPEFFDVLISYGQNTVAWLKNMVDPNLISAFIAGGSHREPKFYYVFQPEYFDKEDLTLSESNQRKILAELEDKFVEYNLNMGFPATPSFREFMGMSQSEFTGYSKMVHTEYVPEEQKIDLDKGMTLRDRLTMILGGQTLQQRANDIAFLANRESDIKLQKLIKACAFDVRLFRMHLRNKLTASNFLMLRRDRKYENLERKNGPDLKVLFSRLYNGSIRQLDPKIPNYFEAVLPNGRKFFVHGDKWREIGTNNTSYGAISIVNHISGYPPKEFADAANELESCFPREIVANAVRLHAKPLALDALRVIRDLPFRLPPHSEKDWEQGIDNLLKFHNIPKNVLAYFHDKGLITADKNGGINFACDQLTGAFRLYFSENCENAFLLQPLANALPFYLPGSRNKLIITENPLVALKVKSQDFESCVLAYGNNMPITRLLCYVRGKDIILHRETNGPISKLLIDFLIDYGFHYCLQYGYVLDKKSTT